MAKKPQAEDHVDRFLVEIGKKLPTVDLRVEGIVDRVMGIQRRVRRMLDETLEEHALSYGEWAVLSSLHLAPENRRTAGELAAKVELSSAAMTNRLDRLEAARLIKRMSDARDRRAVQVELTKKGRDVFSRTVEAQAAKESVVAAALTPRQQDQLNDLLRLLMLEFEKREPKKR